MSTVGEPWFIRIRGQVRGPYSQEQLRVLVRRGAFGRSHEVSQDRTTWRRASILTDLFTPPAANTAAKAPQSAAVSPEDDIELLLGEDLREESKWYLLQNGEPEGPLSEFELNERAAQGMLRPDDRIWSDGAADWAPASSFGLIAFPSSPVPPGEPFRAPSEPPRLARAVSSAYDAGAAAHELPRNSSTAVTSLIFGILGWTLLPFVGAVAAVISGHVAVGEARRSGTSAPGGAVAGLILGYSGLAIATIGVAIWFYVAPSLR
jgi:hypothetical protein